MMHLSHRFTMWLRSKCTTWCAAVCSLFRLGPTAVEKDINGTILVQVVDHIMARPPLGGWDEASERPISGAWKFTDMKVDIKLPRLSILLAVGYLAVSIHPYLKTDT